MSKQSESKAKQNYRAKWKPAFCVNCVHFKIDKIVKTEPWTYTIESNLHCGIGGYAVKKQSTCSLFEALSNG